MAQQLVRSSRGCIVLVIVFTLVAGSLVGLDLSPAVAEVTAVSGRAFNYYTDISLFGGPDMRRGYEQERFAQEREQEFPPVSAASPSVECPEGGGTDSQTDPDGAKAEYGPAVVFGGIWPEEHSSAPPSGPLTSAIDCDLGEDGGVTASTEVTLMPPGAAYPGGVGPGPFVADEVHSSCTATEEGVTSEVTIVNGILETQYSETGEPTETEPVPRNPPVNYTREGTLDHVGDSYRITFNEQIENDDGSITVTAARMELLGPTAVGELVVGQVHCGGDASATPTAGGRGSGGAGGAGGGAAGSGRNQLARTGSSDPLPVAALGVALMLLGVIALQGGRLARPAPRHRR